VLAFVGYRIELLESAAAWLLSDIIADGW
jgi:hypothetical protein